MYIATEDLSVGYAPTSKELTLEERMRQIGVPVIPKPMIRAHKRAYARNTRVGIWKKFSFLPRAYVLIGDYASLYLVFGFVIAMVTVGALLGWAVGDPIVVPFVGAVAGFFVSVVSLAIFSAFMTGLTHGSARYRDFAASGYYWRKVWYALDDSGYPSQTPPVIQKRIRMLQRRFKSEGRLFVEYFGRDPLIGLQVGSETAYFGAWNTDTPLDDY